MLLNIEKPGGIVPRVKDPILLAPDKAQQAVNCRFDEGGILPFFKDTVMQPQDPSQLGIVRSLYVYYNNSLKYYFSWLTTVFATKAPLPNDTYNRVFYTEGGVLKVTDRFLFEQINANQLIASWTNGSPGFDTFTSTSSPDIASAINTAGTGESGHSASITITSGKKYRIVALLTLNSGQAPTISFTNPTTSQALVVGEQNIYFTATGASTVLTMTNTAAANWSCTFMLHEVGTNYPESYLYPCPPQPSTPPSASVTPSGTDPTLEQTRAYSFTYVNGYGEEGPPSLASNYVVCWDGNTVAVTLTLDSLDALYNIVAVRLYRTNQDPTGDAPFQLVAQLTLAAAGSPYNDSTVNANLGQVLPSTLWDPPPVGLTGLISLPNQMLAGFVNNLLCFSAPKYPHAWPQVYQQPTDWPIAGLGAIGTSIVVGTEGQPYVATGNDPSNYVMEKISNGLACMAGLGIVQAGGIVAYPSPEGLFAIGQGTDNLITSDIMTQKDWMDTFNPSSIIAFYYEAKYVAFYQDAVTTLWYGFVFDFKTKDFVDLDFVATAGYHDPVDGALVLQVGTNIERFNDDGTGYLDMIWRSKRYRYLPGTFRVARILAKAYPVRVRLVFPTIPATAVIEAADDRPIRIKPVGITQECEVVIEGPAQFTTAYFATAMEELPT